MRCATKVTNNNIQLLARAIRLAEQVEAKFPNELRPAAEGRVAFGSLVRNRRFAQAVVLLPEELAYEALALLRCMVEIQINLSWIRRDRESSRAIRFLLFESLERLEMIKEMPDSIPPDSARDIIERLEAQRNEIRDIFAEPTKNGRERWAKHWATGQTLRDRLNEIMTSDGITKVPFTYVLYRWASSVVHGGPVSIASVLGTGEGTVQPVEQPLADPTVVFAGAALCLLMTTSEATAIGDVDHDTKQGIASLMQEFTQRFEGAPGWVSPGMRQRKEKGSALDTSQNK